MNVSLTSELEKFIAAKLRDGLYRSASEVVREGLRLLVQQDQIQRETLKSLHHDIQTGLDQLDAGETLMGNNSGGRNNAKHRKRSKNAINIEQMRIACRHVDEMLKAGVTENLSIRTLELLTDVYAKLHSGGSATPHSAGQVDLWSVEAKNIREKYPDSKPGKIVRVEHGTPRRDLARMCLGLFHSNQLNEKKLEALIDRHWKLAVITLEEDKRLNKIARSTMHSTPYERWASAGIKFP